MNIKVKKILFGTLFALMIAGGAVFALLASEKPALVINEICSANDGAYKASAQVKDCDGSLCDWIEIYNPTEEEISLDGYSLSKNGGEEFPLDGFSVGGGEYILVYCSKSGVDSGDVPTAAFNIGKAEDSVIKLSKDGRSCDEINVCAIEKGNSFSRNGEGQMYVSVPTPLAENNLEDIIGATPSFSRTSGFYAEEFDLEIAASEGQKIYYTLDGTDPTSSDTRKEYTGAITIKDKKGDPNTISAYDPTKIQLNFFEQYVHPPEDEDVDKGTVIRACAEGSTGKYGKVVTAAYFVGLTTADHSDMPVISIVCDPFDLYDEETGIYCLGDVFEEYEAEHPDHKYNGSVPANYNQKGREWERECYFEFFESDGTLKLSQDAGMRIQGGWSRADYQKSFRFYARSEYGKSSFDYPFWGEELKGSDGETLGSFKTIIMRNGGNDCNYTKFKDTMFQHMVNGKDFSTQEGRFCVMFINGEYWGFYNLEEDYSEEYFSNHYGVVKNDVVLIKNDKLEEGTEEDFNEFKELCDFISNNDMSVEENYRKAEAAIDMDSLAQYAGMESYIYNTDWPQNNYGWWKTRNIEPGNEYADGRWRCYLFDCESAADHYNTKRENTDSITHISDKKNYLQGGVLNSLLNNSEFRQKYITALCDMANVNFTYFRYRQFLAEYNGQTTEEMDTYYLRFPTAASKEKYVEPMFERMNNFFSKRPDKVRVMLEMHYNLKKKYTISTRIEGGGSVMINGTEAGDYFDGIYYKDCEVTVKAIPDEGYVFAGWKETDSDSDEITLTVAEDVSYTAVFEKSFI